MFSYLSFIVVCVAHFFVDMMIGLWPAYKTFAHLDISIAGLISGACAFLGEGMQVYFGGLSDRGYRKFLIFAGLLATMSAACLFYTRDYMWVCALYMGVCLGSGSFHPAAISFVSDSSKNRNSLLISIFACSGALGMAFSQVIFFQLDTLFDGAVYMIALPAVLLAVGAFAVRSVCNLPMANMPSKSSKKENVFNGIIAFFKNHNLRLLYIFQVCNGTVFWGAMFLLPDILVSRGYEPSISMGYGHLMYVLGSGAMMIPAGYLADKFSSRSVIVGAMALSTLSLYALIFLPIMGNVALLTLLFALGATLGLVNPVAVALATRIAPAQKGLVTAFSLGLVLCVSEVLGHSGGGFITTFFEDDAAAKALAVIGGFLFFGTAAASSLRAEEKVPVKAESFE